MTSRFFEKGEGSQDVGVDKGIRRCDGSIHVGFCCKMTDGIDFVSFENVLYSRDIADIAMNEHIASTG